MDPYLRIMFITRTSNRRYVCNIFYFKCMKTKLFNLNTCTATFLIAASNHLPHENFKLPYLQNQIYSDLSICPQVRRDHIHSIYQKSWDEFSPNLFLLIQPRPCWEEGNCSYLHPLSHRDAGKKVTAVTFVFFHTLDNECRCRLPWTSEWARWRLKSPASRFFTQPFIQGADQWKHQSSASLIFVSGIHRLPVNSPHREPATRKCFHLMTSSWQHAYFPVHWKYRCSYCGDLCVPCDSSILFIGSLIKPQNFDHYRCRNDDILSRDHGSFWV